MNEYTDRRSNSDSWECPCPYRDRCERFSQNNENGRYNRRDRQNGCNNSRSGSCGRSGFSICNLFRGCCNR